MDNEVKHANVKLSTFILIVVLVAIAFGGAGYLYGAKGVAIFDNNATGLLTATATATASASPSTSATKTADVTANWKTYTNDIYGYLIKYPDDWKVLSGIADNKSADANSGTVSMLDPQTKILSPTISKVNEATISDAVSATKSDLDNPIQKAATIGSIKATLISGVISSGNMGAGEQRNRYILESNGTILKIDIDSGNSKLQNIDQILSTFKFTK